MANLETLEITINANAQSASQGLARLVDSLSDVATKTQEAFNGLAAFNSAIKRLTGMSNMKMPDLSKMTGAGKVVSTVKQKVLPAVDAFGRQLQSSLKPFEGGLPVYDAKGDLIAFAKAADTATESMEGLNKTLPKGKSATPWQDFKKSAKEAGEKLGELIPKVKLFSKVMRIASTMLIRMGLRAAFKGIKEGFDNYYQYAKATGHSFATQMDGVNSSLSQLKNQAGAALASALSAALPVLNALANAAITAFNALSQLFALLTGKNSWSKATAQATDYANAANKAGGSGGGLKEQLAAFDELNVIASESGGGGGGAGSAAEDFATMFEESFEFDKNIIKAADALQKAFAFAEDNALAIGAAILGWKLSSEFGGALGLLGNLALGLSITSVGLKLAENWGEKLAVGEGLDTASVLEGVGGILASTLGATYAGYALAGPWGALAGVIIGLGLGLSFTYAGYVKGNLDNLRKMKWGDKEMTPEQIEDYVKSMYTFDIVGHTNLLNIEIDNMSEAKGKMNQAIQELQGSLFKIQFGFETPDELAQKALNVVNTSLEYFQSAREAYAVYMSLKVEDGAIDEMISSITPGEEVLQNVGRQISKLIAEGQKEGWTEQKQDMVTFYATYLNDILAEAEKEKSKLTLGGKSIAGLNDFTDKTAQGIFEKQVEYENDYKDAVRKTQMAIAEGFYGIAAENQAVLDRGIYIDENGKEFDLNDKANAELRKKIEDTISLYTDKGNDLYYNLDYYVDDQLAESRKGYLPEWQKSLKKVYGDFDAGSLGNLFTEIWKGNDIFKDMETGTDISANTLSEYIRTVMGQVDPYLLKISDYFGFTGWDVMQDETKKQLTKELINIFGKDAVSAMVGSFNLDVSELVKFTNWKDLTDEGKRNYISGMVEVFGSDGTIRAIMDETNWSKLSSETKEQIIAELRAVTGDSELIKIAKELGIDITDYIYNGLKDEFVNALNNNTYIKDFIKQYGIDLQKLINDNWKLIAPTVDTMGTEESIKMFEYAARQYGTDIKDLIKNWDLIAPYIDEKNYRTSLYDIYRLSKDEGIELKTVMANWNLIAPTINKVGYNNALTAIKTVASTTGVDVKKVIANWNLIAPYIDEKNVKGSAEKIAQYIANYPKLYIKLGLDGSEAVVDAKTVKQTVQTSIGTIMIPVGVKADGSSVETVTNKVTGGTKVSLATKTPNALLKANGAYGIGMGDVFIANEAGAELVGSINGKTSVANQQQIIEGIASGVESANEQQNALLREQNSLLRGILAKEGTVKIGASAALGRVAQQSIAMYGSMAGGV